MASFSDPGKVPIGNDVFFWYGLYGCHEPFVSVAKHGQGFGQGAVVVLFKNLPVQRVEVPRFPGQACRGMRHLAALIGGIPIQKALLPIGKVGQNIFDRPFAHDAGLDHIVLTQLGEVLFNCRRSASSFSMACALLIWFWHRIASYFFPYMPVVDLFEVHAPMMGLIQTNGFAVRLDISQHRRGELFDFLINRCGTINGESSRATRWDRQAMQPHGLVDNVGIHRRWPDAILLPLVQQCERALIPKCQVCQDGQYCRSLLRAGSSVCHPSGD